MLEVEGFECQGLRLTMLEVEGFECQGLRAYNARG